MKFVRKGALPGLNISRKEKREAEGLGRIGIRTRKNTGKTETEGKPEWRKHRTPQSGCRNFL